MASQNSKGKTLSIPIAPNNNKKAKNKIVSSSQPSGSNTKIRTIGLNQGTNPKPYSSTTIHSNPPAQRPPRMATARQEYSYACGRRFSDIQSLRGHHSTHKPERVVLNPQEVVRPTNVQGFGYPPLRSGIVTGGPMPGFASHNRSNQDLLNRAHVIYRPNTYQPMEQYGTHYLRPMVPSTVGPFTPRPMVPMPFTLCPVPGPNPFQPSTVFAPPVSQFYPSMADRLVPGLPVYWAPHFPVMGNNAGSSGRSVVYEGLPTVGSPWIAGGASNIVMNGPGNPTTRESSANLSFRL